MKNLKLVVFNTRIEFKNSKEKIVSDSFEVGQFGVVSIEENLATKQKPYHVKVTKKDGTIIDIFKPDVIEKK